jgi:hypothetical protein
MYHEAVCNCVSVLSQYLDFRTKQVIIKEHYVEVTQLEANQMYFLISRRQ